MDFQLIKQQLQELKCPDHGQHPEIKLLENGMEFSTCCLLFKRSLLALAQDMIEEDES